MNKTNLFNYGKNCFTKLLKYSLDFKGRLNRTDYIIWNIILFSITVVISIIFGLLSSSFIEGIKLGISFAGLLFFIPNLSLTIKRIHDIGLTGWVVLGTFVPVLGTIFLILLLFLKGEEKENKYGAKTYLCEFGE